MKGWKALFWAAAAYNLAAGGLAVLAPHWCVRAFGLHSETQPELIMAIGMMIAVYAFAYALIALDLKRYGPLVWVGLAGKAFGAVGFVMGITGGTLTWSFLPVTLFNDAIWLFPFAIFAAKYGKISLALQTKSDRAQTGE